jgi:hypothetical protein
MSDPEVRRKAGERAFETGKRFFSYEATVGEFYRAIAKNENGSKNEQ